MQNRRLRVGVVTLFPAMFDLLAAFGVTGRACRAGLLELVALNPRDYATDRHRTVDDRSYGGGPGMVMKPEPLVAALDSLRERLPEAPVICLTPSGRRLDQGLVVELSRRAQLILLAGRYEGIDERVVSRHVDTEVSIGDYVVSGGELPAMVLLDAILRLRPGVLGDAESAQTESFCGPLLDHPHFTRPAEFAGDRVPEVLLGGDHQAVARWRRKQALGRTAERRPDLLSRCTLSAQDRQLLDEYRLEHRSASQDVDRGPLPDRSRQIQTDGRTR